MLSPSTSLFSYLLKGLQLYSISHAPLMTCSGYLRKILTHTDLQYAGTFRYYGCVNLNHNSVVDFFASHLISKLLLAVFILLRFFFRKTRFKAPEVSLTHPGTHARHSLAVWIEECWDFIRHAGSSHQAVSSATSQCHV